MANKEGVKLCKRCKKEISALAVMCPHCGKKQKSNAKWIIIGVVAVFIIGVIASGGDSDTQEASNNNTNVANNSQANEQKTEPSDEPKEETTPEPEEEIQYAAYTVNEMMEDLNNNPLSASDKYKEQYIEITGRLGNIDSDGKYITLLPDDEWSFIGVHCTLEKNNEEQRQAVVSMSIGSQITLRGKCKDVGEIMGYTLDIDSID